MAEAVPLTEWEHYRGTLGGVWEVWRQFRLHTHYDVPWRHVSVPHSYNGLDCVDPYTPYYQGPGWYRKLLEVDNPFRDGRTLLHFEGVGQRSDVFVHTSYVLGHPDPYDNSRDLESVPSDTSEFDSTRQTATVRLNASIADPLSKDAEATVLFAVYGPDGERVAEKRVNVQNAEASAVVQLENPALWSTRIPRLYECVVELESGWGNHEQTSRMLTTMITQHGHHPSVIIWGLGNETTGRVTGIRRCDFCKDIVDVYSPSIWAGWYRGVYREYERYLREHFEDVPRMVHLEWGADNIAGRRAEQPFTGFDEIASGNGAEERDGDFLLQGGDTRVSKDGEWSEGYYVFQSYWASEPVVHIHGHHLPVRWGKVDEPKQVRTYSDCPTVQLFLNGVSMGVRRRDAVARDARGTEVVRDTLQIDYHTEGWGQPHAIDLTLETKGNDLPVVTLTVRDSRANWCLDDTTRVRFSLSGAGRLCSELGTVGGSRVLQLSNGRGRIAVDPQGGRSVISVMADGLPTGFIEIDGTKE